MPDSGLPGAALAARCTACGTVFRVVGDQLRVSDGWVRCGRCSQVFNAAENLIDLETGAPRRLDLAVPAPAAAPATPPSHGPDRSWSGDDAMAATQPLYGPAPDMTPDTRPPAARALPEAGVLPAAAEPFAAGAAAAPPTDPYQPEQAVTAAPAGPRQVQTAPSPAAVVARAPEEPPSLDPASALPSFVRRADRAARWRQPRVRAALAGGAAFAALLLAVQITVAYRDLAAARWPELRPSLEAGCQLLGCRVGPAQAIESLTVESSGLLRVEQTRLYQLTVSLRNRAALELAMPALELSLTDAQGRLLSRRVLRAAELGVTQPTVAAGRDLALQATLLTAPQSTGADGDGVVVGYTIELFYP